MKRILCVGRVVNGAVVIDRPTLEQRIDAQMARNAELLQMHADLDAMLEREDDTQWLAVFRRDDDEFEAIENDHEWIRRGC